MKGTDGGWDLGALSKGEDVEFVEGLGGSINEYEGFRVTFEVRGRPKIGFRGRPKIGFRGPWDGCSVGLLCLGPLVDVPC